MRELYIARHGHACSNETGIADSVPPGGGLTERGEAEARELAAVLPPDVTCVVTSRFRRAQETAAIARPDAPTRVEPGLDEIAYGGFAGGPLSVYLAWAWSSPPELDPGDGESRVVAVTRVVHALHALLSIDGTVLAVSHGAVVRWVVDAAAGLVPRARIEPVGFAEAHRLDVGDVERAAAVLDGWITEPRFADAPNGS